MWKLSQLLGEGTSVSGAKPSPFGQSEKGAVRKDAAHEVYPNLA